MPASAVLDAARKQRNLVALGDQAALGRMIDAYGNAWTAIARDLDRLTADIDLARRNGQVVDAAWLRKERRLSNLLAEVETQITRFARQAAPIIAARQAEAVAAAMRDAHTLTVAALAPGEGGILGGFNRLDSAAVDQLVGHLSPGSPLVQLLAGLGPDAATVAEQALVNGVARGLNPRQMATQMRHALGGNLARALTIARTETLRAYRETTRQTYEKNDDVVAGWRWQSARDTRTCGVCWAMDGTEHPNTDTLDGHPNCRCVMLPITRTFEDLIGVKVDGDELDFGPTGADAFADLPESVQRSILGPGKFDLYKSGDMTLADLVGQVDSKQWGTMRVERSLASITKSSSGSNNRSAGRTVDRAPKSAPMSDPGDYLSDDVAGAGPRSKVGRGVAEAKDVIRSVHRVPDLSDTEVRGYGKQLLVKQTKSDSQGVFIRRYMLNDPSNAWAESIGVSTKGDAQAFAFTHEFGHFLDFMDFGQKRRFTTAAKNYVRADDPRFVRFWKAVDDSDAYTTIRNMRSAPDDFVRIVELGDGRRYRFVPNSAHLRYLSEPEELFARAYSQWVAEKSGNRAMLDGLESFRSGPYPMQWSTEDFAPIADALDELFRAEGMLN